MEGVLNLHHSLRSVSASLFLKNSDQSDTKRHILHLNFNLQWLREVFVFFSF